MTMTLRNALAKAAERQLVVLDRGTFWQPLLFSDWIRTQENDAGLSASLLDAKAHLGKYAIYVVGSNACLPHPPMWALADPTDLGHWRLARRQRGRVLVAGPALPG
jgi:hypothetical protein